jgi:hypothetical protein
MFPVLSICAWPQASQVRDFMGVSPAARAHPFYWRQNLGRQRMPWRGCVCSQSGQQRPRRHITIQGVRCHFCISLSLSCMVYVSVLALAGVHARARCMSAVARPSPFSPLSRFLLCACCGLLAGQVATAPGPGTELDTRGDVPPVSACDRLSDASARRPWRSL